MKGLYFYKLVSPYTDDVTKDCKLTVNEIDHNFITLKDADIKDATFDKETNTISLIRNNKEELQLDLSPMVEGITTDLSVDYDSIEGKITIAFNGEYMVINGLVTEDNLSDAVLTEVISDGTLRGLGSKKVPLGIAAVEKTGMYKPVIKLIDRVNGEMMPPCQTAHKGDRYLTRESVSDYGYLYNFKSICKIKEDLKNGWRIPSKEDWDDMLNAIEPCDEYRTHNQATANTMLGKYAGKLLKSRKYWLDSACSSQITPCLKETEVCTRCTCDEDWNDDVLLDGDDAIDFEPSKPQVRPVSPKGNDAFGMGLMPSGFRDACGNNSVCFNKHGYYWTDTMNASTDVYAKRFDYNKSGVWQELESPLNFLSLRLVKDYDGTNFHEVEHINGMNYETVLMPSLCAPHGFSIWTKTNIAFPNKKYNPIEPNMGLGLSSHIVYFINEWNGFAWERKAMSEGESVVLIKGLNNDSNMDYRLIDGELVSVASTIFDQVQADNKVVLDRINQIIGEGVKDENNNYVDFTSIIGSGLTNADGERFDMTTELNDLDAYVKNLQMQIKQEIADRFEADSELNDRIEILKNDLNEEISNREDAISAVTTDLTEFKTLVAQSFEDEQNARQEKDAELEQAIKREETVRQENDDKITTRIDDVQTELDKTQSSIGLKEDGAYEPKEDSILENTTTVIEGIDLLADKLKEEEITRQENDDKIINGVGLDEDGAYVQNEDGKYISEAISINDAINKLDTALDTLENTSGNIQDELDKTQKAVGLNEDGTYPTQDDANYIQNSENVIDALKKLDGALKSEEDTRIQSDADLDKQLINATQEDDAFDVQSGVLTLKTKEGAEIKIKLHSDYGVFPSPQV